MEVATLRRSTHVKPMFQTHPPPPRPPPHPQKNKQTNKKQIEEPLMFSEGREKDHRSEMD